MLTKEQIEEIQAESREKGVSIKEVLNEKGIAASQYFWWRRKYAKAEVPEGFLPVAGAFPPGVVVAAAAANAVRGKSSPQIAESWMTIELRTGSGTDMRIQGGLSPEMVYTILKSV